MKRKIFLSSLLCTILLGEAISQDFIEPQWKFYFAFEDASGQRDTIWLYQDSGINSWYPNEYESYGIFPIEIPAEGFTVYTGYSASEWGKVAVGNIEWPMDLYIFAENHTYPITLSWDTTLFNSSVLQQTVAGSICNPVMSNEWLNGQTNAPWLHNQYSMLFDNQVILPPFNWGDENHFPIFASFGRAHNCNPLGMLDEIKLIDFQVYPNPSSTFVVLQSAAELVQLEVFDLQGRRMIYESWMSYNTAVNSRIDVSLLPPGMYLFAVIDREGRRGSKKFVRSE